MEKLPYLLGIICFVCLSSCEKKEATDLTTFDRKEMLEFYSSEIIQPAYEDLLNSILVFKTAFGVFQADPNENTLRSLQEKWVSAYTNWQYANGYNFGPAGEQGIQKGLIEEIGTFPVSTTKIEAAILAEAHSFNNFDRDARGFLALEYLIFGKDQTNEAILVELGGSSSRMKHIEALLNHLMTKVEEVSTAWKGYSSAFISNEGTDAGSSISGLYNEFVRSFESLKNFKVGLPAGKRPGQTGPAPELLEAFYSGQSLEMIKSHFQALEQIYYGQTKSGQIGIGFKDYLLAVEGGKELVFQTEEQLQNVKNALLQIPANASFSALVAQNDPSIEALFIELQKHTRFFKSDMSSLLGISITFSSGDGD